MKLSRAENIMFFAKRDLEMQTAVLLESIQLWEKHPELIREFTQEYLLNLNNILVSSIESLNFTHCDVTFEKLRVYADVNNKSVTNIVRTRAFAFYQYNLLKYHNTKGEHDLTLKAFDRSRFEELGLKLNSYKRTQIILELVVGHLFSGDFRGVVRNALDALAKHENFQQEVLSQIRNFFYIAHFHRKNLETLEQRLQSKDKLIQGWFEEYEQEKALLELLIGRLKNEVSKDDLKSFCENYVSKVNPHFNHYLILWSKNSNILIQR